MLCGESGEGTVKGLAVKGWGNWEEKAYRSNLVHCQVKSNKARFLLAVCSLSVLQFVFFGSHSCAHMHHCFMSILLNWYMEIDCLID